jgi:HEAT repeat protein
VRTAVDERARALDRLLERAASHYRLEHRPPHERLRELLFGDEPWLVVCALHEIAELDLQELRAAVVPHLRSTSPLVRETALRALVRLDTPAAVLEHCEVLADDPEDNVARAVEHYAALARRALPPDTSAPDAAGAAVDGALPPTSSSAQSAARRETADA